MSPIRFLLMLYFGTHFNMGSRVVRMEKLFEAAQKSLTGLIKSLSFFGQNLRTTYHEWPHKDSEDADFLLVYFEKNK